jgi:hypothetical protein
MAKDLHEKASARRFDDLDDLGSHIVPGPASQAGAQGVDLRLQSLLMSKRSFNASRQVRRIVWIG